MHTIHLYKCFEEDSLNRKVGSGVIENCGRATETLATVVQITENFKQRIMYITFLVHNLKFNLKSIWLWYSIKVLTVAVVSPGNTCKVIGH